MGALAVTDVRVAVAQQDRGAIQGAVKRLAFAVVSYGDGALTYPTGGIPLPGIGAFGMNKAIEHVFIENPGNGYSYAFDKVNQKLKILVPKAAAGTVAAPALTMDSYTPAGSNANDGPPETFTGTAHVLTGTVAAPAFTGAAAGAMVELANTVAPAATVLNLMIIGN